MLELAISRGEPAAVRYPRGSLMQAVSSVPVEKGKWEILEPIAEKTVIATGSMVSVALPVARKLGAGLVNARTFRPLDDETLEAVKQTAKLVVVMEEGVDCLGFAVTAAVAPIKVIRMNVSCMEPVTHATVNSQREHCGLTACALEQYLTEKTV